MNFKDDLCKPHFQLNNKAPNANLCHNASFYDCQLFTYNFTKFIVRLRNSACTDMIQFLSGGILEKKRNFVICPMEHCF